ncbi:hypothetical protein E2C01_017209 [Portunus trituberculatus]|uniref:Uncharacterized protein n=1 Tax=Portunus trituberculatus TaxID=210409 RepID=A0A5B7DSJ9_PORTR|nr:hypothetical protein [Portunus trituberculatus]
MEEDLVAVACMVRQGGGGASGGRGGFVSSNESRLDGTVEDIGCYCGAGGTDDDVTLVIGAVLGQSLQ